MNNFGGKRKMSSNGIMIVGPFPTPIHGMSLSNDLIYNELIKREINVIKENTNMEINIKDKKLQGKFSFDYFLFSIKNSISIIKNIIIKKPKKIYITPGQSPLGLSRFLPIILVSKLLGKDVYLHIHGSKLSINYNKTNILFKFFMYISLYSSNKIIFLGEKIAKDHAQLVKKNKITICNNGIPIPDRNLIKQEKLSKKINILYLSNLMREKGILDLISAIELINNSNISFDLAGEIEDSLRNILTTTIPKINCNYHGIVEGKAKNILLNKADILILPSYDEGQPLCILEAYSYGCAVITTDVGGIRDIFKNNINGIFCQVNNPLSIVDAIEKTINNLENFKLNNRVLAEEKYSTEKYVDNLLKIIEE